MDQKDYTPSGFVFNEKYENSARSLIRDGYNLFRQPYQTKRYSSLIPMTVRQWRPTWVLCGIGIPRTQTCRILKRLASDPIHKIAILGCGTAWDFGQWFRLKPEEIIAIDLYRFEDAWQQVRKVAERKGIRTRFYQTNLEDLSVINDSWADLVISDAVFEHCQNLPVIISEAKRVLKPGGIIYASYGPLWFGPAGDHYSVRGGLENIYNHLFLDKKSYEDYFKAFHLGNAEDAQSGGRYVPLDLFSKYSSDQYLELFRNEGLTREVFAVQISHDALDFRSRYPDSWVSLREKFSGFSDEQFIIDGHFIFLRNPLFSG